jgi:RNA polymerase sigma-70 factor (ECF subfamily)
MSSADDDRRLMLRVKAGDREAFAALYARFAGPLFRYLLGLAGRRDAAEDALQETFLRIWRAAPEYEPAAALSTWLFTIARNAGLNVLARERVRIPHPGDRATGPDPGPRPGDRLEAEERADAVRRAVVRLPAGERDAVLLSLFAGLRYAEIARVLDIPEGTVKSRMASAVGKLGGMLRGTDGEPRV